MGCVARVTCLVVLMYCNVPLFYRQRWRDENMIWNATMYSDIQTIRVPASYIWLPDTFIFNKYVYPNYSYFIRALIMFT